MKETFFELKLNYPLAGQTSYTFPQILLHFPGILELQMDPAQQIYWNYPLQNFIWVTNFIAQDSYFLNSNIHCWCMIYFFSSIYWCYPENKWSR